MTTTPATPAPEGFDAVAHVAHSLASVPWRWEVEVVLDLPLAATAERIPPTLAELVDAGEQTRASHARRLARLDGGRARRLDCDFTVVEPPELRESVTALARISRPRSQTAQPRSG